MQTQKSTQCAARVVLRDDAGRGAWEGLEWRPSVTREAYDRALAAIRSRIREGDTYQVNFTYRLRACHAIDPWTLFLRLAGGGDAPFAAFVDTGGGRSTSWKLFCGRRATASRSGTRTGCAWRVLSRNCENTRVCFC